MKDEDFQLLLVAGGVGLFIMANQKKPSPPVPPVAGGKVSPEERAAVVQSIALLGWPVQEIDTAIRVESGWRTTAINPVSYAAGLIQLMPVWLRQRQFHPNLDNRGRAQAFAALPASQQLPYILEYFRDVGRRWRVAGDTYMALAAPSYVGAPDSTVIYKVDSAAWRQNPGWRPAGSASDITAGSIRAFFLSKMPAGQA